MNLSEENRKLKEELEFLKQEFFALNTSYTAMEKLFLPDEKIPGGFIYLETVPDCQARYGYGKPGHKQINQILTKHSSTYLSYLQLALKLKNFFLAIPLEAEDAIEPYWENGFLAPLDASMLYTFIYNHKPAHYLEIGSGNSTKFVRRAIKDHGLKTRIVSIDPQPRAEIDALCDEVLRKPVESIDLSLFNQLKEGDILFLDGSHRCFMNSDVMVFFFDILPNLPSGVIVHIHDIFWPFDYSEIWNKRFCNEQYLLGAYLLGKGEKIKILQSNSYVRQDPQLNAVLAPIWKDLKIEAGDASTSFWFLA